MTTSPAARALCALADLPPGTARGFDPAADGQPPLFGVHGPEGVAIFVNACPHLGVPLDWLPGRFLSADGKVIICATHGAEFRLADGLCLRGPCRGDSLTKAAWAVLDGMIMVGS